MTDTVQSVHEEERAGTSKSILESRFECPICLGWLKDPILTSCGHKFCSTCIFAWLRKTGTCCPVDSKPLEPDRDLFRDLHTSREISQQKTHCPHRQFGCLVELSPIEMESHINDCEYKRESILMEADPRRICCSFKPVGCKDTFANEEEHRLHMEKNTNFHLMMVGNALPRLISCPNESRAAESKLWDPPLKNNNSESASKEEPLSDWQELVKSLYERIVILEQQNRELTISLSNQDKRLTGLQTNMKFNEEELFLRNCNGVYIWRLQGFTEKLETMLQDPLKMFYSPGFYTEVHGYRICARVNISSKDNEFLSLLLHIMRSDNDEALDWPFRGTMCFVLKHPRHPEKDICEITGSKIGLEAFRRPVCELNKRSFGYTEFVRVEDLKDFLWDSDTLIFRIQVKAEIKKELL